MGQIITGVSNSFVGAGHTASLARYHSVGGPHCFRDAVNAVINTDDKNII